MDRPQGMQAYNFGHSPGGYRANFGQTPGGVAPLEDAKEANEVYWCATYISFYLYVYLMCVHTNVDGPGQLSIPVSHPGQ